MKMEKLFGGQNSEQYNAVYNAILQCGQDHLESFPPKEREVVEGDSPYEWLENTPKTSITAELVNKLNELGFEIRRVGNGSNDH